MYVSRQGLKYKKKYKKNQSAKKKIICGSYLQWLINSIDIRTYTQ